MPPPTLRAQSRMLRPRRLCHPLTRPSHSMPSIHTAMVLPRETSPAESLSQASIRQTPTRHLPWRHLIPCRCRPRHPRLWPGHTVAVANLPRRHLAGAPATTTAAVPARLAATRSCILATTRGPSAVSGVVSSHPQNMSCACGRRRMQCSDFVLHDATPRPDRSRLECSQSPLDRLICNSSCFPAWLWLSRPGYGLYS